MKPKFAYQRHDLTDKTWKQLEPHLPARAGSWGGVAQDDRLFIRWRDKGVWQSLLNILISNPDFEWLMIDASHVKVHPQASDARGGNEAMSKTKGGSTPKYIFPWMRMVCRTESLSQKAPKRHHR